MDRMQVRWDDFTAFRRPWPGGWPEMRFCEGWWLLPALVAAVPVWAAILKVAVLT